MARRKCREKWSDSDCFLVERIAFLQDLVLERTEPWTATEMQNAIQKFIHRNDEELASLKKGRRPGRPPSAQEALIKRNEVEAEKEYKSGFWLPDLEDETTVKELKEWEGDWLSLNKLKFARIANSGLKQASTFPPNGKS